MKISWTIKIFLAGLLLASWPATLWAGGANEALFHGLLPGLEPAQATSPPSEGIDVAQMGLKFIRGLSNFVTSPLEIPKGLIDGFRQEANPITA